jgi:uncharacterized membrane protein YczE
MTADRSTDAAAQADNARTSMPLLRSGSLLVAGWVLVAAAIAALIRLDLGVAPYDVLNVGIGARLGIAPGTAMWLSGTVMIAAAWLMGQRPGPATPLGFLTIGLCINVLLPHVPAIASLPVRALVLLPVLVVLYLGVCLIIVSGLGAGPTEVLMLALADKGLGLRTARWLIELGCAVGGFLLGGPVGALTAVLIVASAPIIAALLPVTRRILGTTITLG